MTAQELRRKLERQQKELVKVYNKAYSDLQERLKRQELRGLSTYHTKALLEDVERISAELESYVESWIRNNYPDAYELGSSTAVEKLTKHYKMGGINSSFGGVHQAAIEAIVSDTLSDIASATSYMQDGLKKAIRDAAKQKYPAGLITGDTRKSITKEMVQNLNTKGFTAYYDEKGRYIPLKQYADAILSENWVGFVDKSGRRWDLLNYSEMLTRTKALEATNTGTENRMRENGLDLVLISSHHADDWCKFYENRVFSISGESSEYPPLSQTPNRGCPFHPRCKHSETPFIEKFEGEETIDYGRGIDKKFLVINLENSRADQAKLREYERLYIKR